HWRQFALFYFPRSIISLTLQNLPPGYWKIGYRSACSSSCTSCCGENVSENNDRRALPMKKAVVLLSGGLDSATALAIARQKDFACHVLSIDYGQRHGSELAAAARIGQSLRVS